MKIGIDCRLWNETGVGRYIRNLVLNLQKIDKKNEYILFMRSEDVVNFQFQASSFQFQIVKTDIRWHTVEEQLKFPQILNKEDLDIMHFPYFSVPIFYNRPFVVTIHDLIMHHFSTGQASTHSSLIYGMKLLGYKYVISQAAKKAKKIIAVSNATKDEIVDHLKVDPQKVVVTHEGVDDKISNPKSQIPNKLQITNYKLQNSKYFLYVGNAYPHKNLDRLLEAFNLLCHPDPAKRGKDPRLQMPPPDSALTQSMRAGGASAIGGQVDSSASPQNDIALVLVGKEDYFYKRLKEKVKNMGLDKKVIFFGQATDEELANLYANARAFVTPSLMEGFGLPALETMANRCLVLASNIPSLKEICGDGAIYFDPYSIQDIEKTMQKVCSNDTYHYSDKKELGLKRAKLFSWQKMAKETLAVYGQAASNS